MQVGHATPNIFFWYKKKLWGQAFISRYIDGQEIHGSHRIIWLLPYSKSDKNEIVSAWKHQWRILLFYLRRISFYLEELLSYSMKSSFQKLYSNLWIYWMHHDLVKSTKWKIKSNLNNLLFKNIIEFINPNCNQDTVQLLQLQNVNLRGIEFLLNIR